MTDEGVSMHEEKEGSISILVITVMLLIIVATFVLGLESGRRIERSQSKSKCEAQIKSQERCEERVLVFMNPETGETMAIRSTISIEKTKLFVRYIYPQNKELILLDELPTRK